jgi:hypothetical protein
MALRMGAVARAKLWQRAVLVAASIPVVLTAMLGVAASRPVDCGDIPCLPNSDLAGSWIATAEWGILLLGGVAATGFGFAGRVRFGSILLGATVLVMMVRLFV